MGRWFFNWTCDDEDVGSEPNPQPESSGHCTALSFTTWLLPEVVPSYGRLNEYYCFNICLSLHDTFVRINCLELDGRLAWWRAALTIFTSYVNWNYYKLHPRCFFWPLWRLQLGGCGDTVRREEVHHSSGCAPYQRILSACAPFVRPPILQPSAHRGRLSHNPSQNGSPANLTKASSSSLENIELSFSFRKRWWHWW